MVQPRAIKFCNFMLGDCKNLELMRSQLSTLSSQLPLMYCILMVSSLVLSYNFIHVAPVWLTLYAPILGFGIALIRSIFWLSLQTESLGLAQAKKLMKSVIALSVIISLAFTSWSVTLFHYGGDLHKAHVAFYMAITVISCIFCLGSLPSAALIVSIVVNGTFIAFFALKDDPFFQASAANIAFVSIGMIFVMRKSYQNSAKIVKQQLESQRLVEINENQANRDSLTGLGNRRFFYKILEDECKSVCDNNKEIAVGAIDLDGFKPINDIYGHLIPTSKISDSI